MPLMKMQPLIEALQIRKNLITMIPTQMVMICLGALQLLQLEQEESLQLVEQLQAQSDRP